MAAPKFYRAVRRNGAPRHEYLGSGTAGRIVAERIAWERAARELDRQEVRESRAEVARLLGDLSTVEQQADKEFRGGMTAAGFHRHRRGEWRRSKASGGRGVSVLAGLFNTDTKPRPVVDLHHTDPEVDTVSTSARVSEPDEVEVAAELLAKRPDLLGQFGDPTLTARARLIQSWAAGYAVPYLAAATRLGHRRTELLAEVPNPTAAEVLAADRVATTEFVVGLLEAKAAAAGLGTPKAEPFDKALTRAERRLAVAQRSLATLRKLRKPSARIGPVNVLVTPPQSKPHAQALELKG